MYEPSFRNAVSIAHGEFVSSNRYCILEWTSLDCKVRPKRKMMSDENATLSILVISHKSSHKKSYWQSSSPEKFFNNASERSFSFPCSLVSPPEQHYTDLPSLGERQRGPAQSEWHPYPPLNRGRAGRPSSRSSSIGGALYCAESPGARTTSSRQCW